MSQKTQLHFSLLYLLLLLRLLTRVHYFK